MRRANSKGTAWRFALAVALIAPLAGDMSSSAHYGGLQEEGGEITFHVVAEQTIELTDDSFVWQISELPTFRDREDSIPFYRGFLYAHAAPLVVYRDGGRRFARLGVDDAFPMTDGELLAPVALGAENATFFAVELVTEDDAFDPLGDPFTMAPGDYVLELLRAASDPKEVDEDEDAASFDTLAWPVALIVATGALEVLHEDEDADELKAGDAVTLDRPFTLRWGGEEPGVVLIAALRPAADDEPTPAPTPARGSSGTQGGGSQGSSTQSNGTQGSGSDNGGGTAPTPTPEPTEEPDGSSGGTLPGVPPPTDDPPDSGGSGGTSSGGVGVETRPRGGPCLLADGDGDPDFDELDNCGEAAAGTNPYVQDTDGDGAWDGFEVRTGTNPRAKDTDGDGLGDWDEFTYSTNPLTPDTDGDGLTDHQEIAVYGTKPTFVDTDSDCLWDGDEVLNYGTNPWLKDSDGDGYEDSWEISLGFNPLDRGHFPEDVVAGTGCGALAVRVST